MIKDRFLSKMSSIGSLERKLLKIRIYFFSDYVPLIFFSEVTSPYIIIGEVKCNKLIKKTPQTLKNGEGQVCVLLNTQNSSLIIIELS